MIAFHIDLDTYEAERKEAVSSRLSAGRRTSSVR